MNLVILLISLFGVKWNCIEKQYFDYGGRMLSGGLVYFYYPGTMAHITVYHDAGATPMTNPVVLDGSGHAKICGDMDQAYSVNVMDQDNVLTWQTGFNGPSYYFAGVVTYDTIYLALKTDTIIKIDTVIRKDTIKVVKVDTIKKVDTVYQSVLKIHDTLTLTNLQIIIDTLKLIQHDTIIKTITDTLHKIDTFNIIQHDTVNTCKDGTFAKYSEKLFASIGSSTSDNPVTISERSGNSPSVEVETNTDIDVEVYVYDNLGVAVTSGTYVIKSSTNKQYIKFNGYAKNGVKVPNGVYLMRIVSGHNNMISNNVYRIGIRNRVAD
jgi:hypothetical protein